MIKKILSRAYGLFLAKKWGKNNAGGVFCLPAVL